MSFTLADVKELIRLLSETDIVELQLDLESEGARLSIRKAGAWIQANQVGGAPVGVSGAGLGLTAASRPESVSGGDRSDHRTLGRSAAAGTDEAGEAGGSSATASWSTTLTTPSGDAGQIPGAATVAGAGRAPSGSAAGAALPTPPQSGATPGAPEMMTRASTATPETASGEKQAQARIDTGRPATVVDGSPLAAEARQVPVVAPMVGTFYRGPAPDAPPFVEVGSKVTAGQTLCVIEAMKLMNEITAETAGRVIAILAADGEPVEYGQTLFLLEPEPQTRG